MLEAAHAGAPSVWEAGEQVTCTATALTRADIDATSGRNTATATGTLPDGDPIESLPGETIVPARRCQA